MGVVGNKADLYNDEKVNEQSAIKWAKDIGAIFQVTSAAQGTGINEIFNSICENLINFNKKDNEETNKSYIVYTDNSKDENGKVRVYASIYHPDDPKTKLEDIKTDKEWKIIDTILTTLQEEIANTKPTE